MAELKMIPYKGYYDVVEEVLKRDNYTCQVCGFYGVESVHAKVTVCLECERKGIPFSPDSEWRVPNPCRDKGFKSCGQCPSFREYSIEYLSFAKLVVHHKDGDKCNQKLENLVTVCTSCHKRLHQRNRILSVEELRRKIKGKDSAFLKG
ncbi:MAG: hypothetical protein QHH12_04935 [Candidatus Bathyarchaeota archaeon]|jgi:5-methylcytosine-specific restriction endonuclease McrA|nr:hypothetical protein [Candidatus Bathyarchaeota archaeon A05DMB-3]MDH7607095.1 hypothetical protein [Candidatus Bathyarchaeota archaeon]